MQNLQHTEDLEQRFAPGVRPIAAISAAAQFLMDVEQTHHVFRLTDALDNEQNERNYQRYIKTEMGAKLESDGFDLGAHLSDRTRMETYPSGSLGRAYIDFLDREELDLGMLLAAEEVAERAYSHLDEPRRKFISAGTANHDLLHVLTGYGREPLGEALLLTFTAQQFSLRGIAMLSHMMAMREWAQRPAMPILQLLGEAKTVAKKMIWIAEIDWREVLPLDLDEARASLNVSAPQAYLSLDGKVDPALPEQGQNNCQDSVTSKAA